MQDQEDPGLPKKKGRPRKASPSKNMMTIQGLIWNCRGLRKKGVATFLKNLISQYSFHFIGLQETMIENYDDKILKHFDSN
jgi:hypothetical protein